MSEERGGWEKRKKEVWTWTARPGGERAIHRRGPGTAPDGSFCLLPLGPEPCTPLHPDERAVRNPAAAACAAAAVLMQSLPGRRIGTGARSQCSSRQSIPLLRRPEAALQNAPPSRRADRPLPAAPAAPTRPSLPSPTARPPHLRQRRHFGRHSPLLLCLSAHRRPALSHRVPHREMNYDYRANGSPLDAPVRVRPSLPSPAESSLFSPHVLSLSLSHACDTRLTHSQSSVQPQQ